MLLIGEQQSAGSTRNEANLAEPSASGKATNCRMRPNSQIFQDIPLSGDKKAWKPTSACMHTHSNSQVPAIAEATPKEPTVIKVDTSFLTDLKASGHMPSPTGVALTILDLTRNPEASSRELTDVLKGDPALAGQVLKYANSARLGSRIRFTSLNDAIVRMGMKMVRQLCLGFSVLSSARNGPCARFDYPRYWAYSLATAVGSQILSRRISSVCPDEGFTCGLLANIGSLALASVYPDEYCNILNAWNSGTHAELLALEERALMLNHRQVTAAIFSDWGLPEFYQEAMLNRDNQDWIDTPDPADKPNRARKLANLLSIADLAAKICLETGDEQHRLVLEFMHIGTRLQIPEPEWIAMYDDIMQEWTHMGDVLDIVTSNVPSMENLVKRAREYDQPLDDLGEDSAAQKDFGLNILVVTDSVVDQRMLQKKLTSEGHNVDVAGTGNKALELALQTNPQLILSDWMMPEMDGLELCRTLRQSELGGRCHFLIMTSNDSKKELEEGFEAGIDDYLVKPLNHRILLAKLRVARRLIQLQIQSEQDKKEIQRTMKTLGQQKRQLQKMFDKVERLAMEDQLTQLPNRRAGLARLDEIWAESRRNADSMLVMILDIDKFKKVNDTYGHDAGDVVLRSTAAIMRNSLREYDVVSRFGGEEFLVICPRADAKVAKDLGDRIRQAVENNHIEAPEFTGNITISVGVSILNEKYAKPEEMIKEADEALYAAKEAGRNLVCIA